MNISNTISYDSTYSKNDSAQPEIKQNVSIIIEKSQINEELEKLDALDNKIKTDDITDAVGKSNETLQAFDRKLEMTVHKKTREIIVKVIDTITDEVIREIPAEKVLDTVASRREMLGLLMDQKI